MNKQEILSKLLHGKNRIKILNSIKEKEKVSSEIEEDTKLYKSHISKYLNELKEMELVYCLNPNVRNYKFYKITTKGKNFLKEAEKIKKKIEK
jgi:predicted transcriptional regulator